MNHLKNLSFGLLMLFLFTMSLYAQNMGSGSISGIVMSETDNLPIANAKVFVFKTQNMMTAKQFKAETDLNGVYKVDNLPQGKYIVYAQVDSFVAEFYKNTNNPALAIPIEITNGASATDIDFYLELGAIISGMVSDSMGVGIPKAFVTATPHSSFPQPAWLDSIGLWGGAQTDENGYYKITTLDSGAYRVSAKIMMETFPFFQIKYYDNKDNFLEADPVLVDNGQKTPDINFQFDYSLPTGGIAGTITDANGDPLKCIYVLAWKYSNGDSFYSNFRGFRRLVKTDENGKYEIKNLSNGKYVVSATQTEWRNFETIYYDGVSHYKDATPVPVADTTTAGIDFVFGQAVDLGAISGNVTSDDDGTPVANAFVQAMWVGSNAGHGSVRFRASTFAWTDANGDYKIDLLYEGKYIVLVHKNGYTEFYDDTQDIDQATKVEVQPGIETTGTDFGVPAIPDTGSKVSGIVTNDSTGNPVEGAIVTLFPVSDSPRGNAFRGKFTLFDFYTTVSDANGKYMIAGIPAGKYIAVCWAQEFIVEFFDDKSTPWDADQFDLDGNDEKNDVDFALIPGWRFRHHGPGENSILGMISGQVTDNENRLVAGAYVSVIDGNYQVRATEMTGADGSYTLAGIPEGDYYIKVDRMPYSTAYYGNTIELGNATPVTMGEAGTFSVTSVDIELIPMSATSVEENGNVTNVPGKFELMQNYPNPFNPTTTFRYALPEAAHVTLKVYNLRGELVKTLVNGYQTALNHQVNWNGDNEAGQKVAAGVYLYQLQAGNHKQTMRLILLK